MLLFETLFPSVNTLGNGGQKWRQNWPKIGAKMSEKSGTYNMLISKNWQLYEIIEIL